MCMVQNKSEHLSPATYRQRHRWRIALATVQFFSHTLFSLATFWKSREEGEKESAGDGEEGEKESAGDGEGG